MRRFRRLPRTLIAPFAVVLSCAAVRADPSLQPASAQPTLPQPVPASVPGNSPILGGESTRDTTLIVRKKTSRSGYRLRHVRHHVARYDREPLDRPALAGVQLVAPLPHPIQPPHFTVPTPAYPFENFVTYFTTPPPPVICHRVPRDPYAPDPRLLYEKPVVCEADNP